MCRQNFNIHKTKKLKTRTLQNIKDRQLSNLYYSLDSQGFICISPKNVYSVFSVYQDMQTNSNEREVLLVMFFTINQVL